ncbi:hypothetical protein OIU78_001103 [Salix suchowensis]|nr:hypothetical protein OIU78_001103 [Salix suchowensis]
MGLPSPSNHSSLPLASHSADSRQTPCHRTLPSSVDSPTSPQHFGEKVLLPLLMISPTASSADSSSADESDDDAAIAATNGGSDANKELVVGHASRVYSAALGFVQPADPMSAEIDALQVVGNKSRKGHRSNKHSHKKPPMATTDALARPAAASARPAVLAEQSKSGVVLNSLNSEVDVGLAVGIASASVGNPVGLKSDSVVGVAKVVVVDPPAVNVSAIPPPSARLFNRSLMPLLHLPST